MKKMKFSLVLVLMTGLVLAACSSQSSTTSADDRQAAATEQSMDAADREIGMPRIVNYAQRKLLKNAYEDMDQTTLTYVYAQSDFDGKFICLGQAVGYGVSMGTQFTSPTRPELLGLEGRGIYARPQPEPNGLFMPESGAATIVNLIDPVTGIARTSLVEPDVVTTPNRLPASAVSVACPTDVSADRVRDGKEESTVAQRD